MTENSNNINPFDKIPGSASLANPKGIVLLFVAVSVIALILAKLEIVGLGILFALLFGVIYLYLLFKNPVIGFYTAIGLNFLLLGLGRYVMGLPLGFGIDGIMILTFLAIIFSRFRERVDWAPANKTITVLAAIWLGILHISTCKP